MPTLYRRYRPQTFAEVSGQDHIKITLEYEIMANRLAHAYLFCGPRAIGKTTIARLLAKAVNCPNKKKNSAEPCNTCEFCREITDGRALDILEIDAASHTGVDNVRESVIASARVTPGRCRYKVFIIDEAHMLSTAAWNALLKVMEEPPEYVIFILCTTEAHKVPATIISRCQRFDFRKIGYTDILKKLNKIIKEEKVEIEEEVLEAVARHSGGHMRDAESLLGQVISLGSAADSLKGKKITLAEAELVIPRSYLNETVSLLEFLIEKKAAEAVEQINRLVEDGADLKVFNKEVVEVSRRLFLAKVSPTMGAELLSEFGQNVEARLLPLSSNSRLDFLSYMTDRLVKAGLEIKDSPLAQLPLELAVVDICLFSVPRDTSTISGGGEGVGQGKGQGQGQQTTGNITQQNSGTQKSINDSAGTKTGDGDNKQSGFSLSGNSSLEVNSLWKELLVKIKPYNHSLSFILKSCLPVSLEGNSLRIVFKYKLHYDRIKDEAVKSLVEKVASEIVGQNLIVEAVLDPSLTLPEIKSVEEEFGGNNTRATSSEYEQLDNDQDRGEGEREGMGEDKEGGEGNDNSSSGDDSVINNLLKTFGGRVV